MPTINQLVRQRRNKKTKKSKSPVLGIGYNSKDKKIVSFVGTTKNGTSFLVNNVAEILSMNGIDTAILDLTKNKNSYYIYTKNEEEYNDMSKRAKKLYEEKFVAKEIYKELADYLEKIGRIEK